ncbi:hypothetical protein HY631_04215 [Candidatus Uhrbacteria bacterium]|nr:hypothetical protein [Candidatus Uhrbacteria bacterium]
MEATYWFRPDTVPELQAFLSDTSVYEIENVRAIAQEAIARGPYRTVGLPTLSDESKAFVKEFADDPVRTFDREMDSVVDSLGLLHLVLLARVASGRPPLKVAGDCLDLMLEVTMQAQTRQPFAEGLRLWANLFHAYGGRKAHGPALRAVVHLLISIRAESNRLTLFRHLPSLVGEVVRLIVSDSNELSQITPVQWEHLRTNSASSVLAWARFAARHKIPLSEGAIRLRYALFIARVLQGQGAPLLFPDDGLELCARLLARGIDLSTLQTFLERYGENRLLWLTSPGGQADGRFLRELSRMFATFASVPAEELSRMRREWQELCAMDTSREFTLRQFLELGGSLDAALEELSRPEPPRDLTNVVELFPPVPILKRPRLAVVNVKADDLEVNDLALGRHKGELIQTVCAEVWRIGYPGRFDPARATDEARLERLCLPKCRVTRGQFAEAMAWLLVEGAIRREGMALFPGPVSHATDLGHTIAERAEALKRSALVPEQDA